MRQFPELDEIAEDILREIGSIGAGNAVTALFDMTGESFQVTLPEVTMVHYRDVPEILGGAEVFEAGTMLEVSGDISGMFMFLLNEAFSKTLLNALLGSQERDFVHLDSLCTSAICEVGNIVCGSYINALARLMDVQIQVSVPDICVDMAGAILSVPMIHFANLGEELLLIKNQFRTEELEFTGHVLFLPEAESLEKILRVLGD